MSDFVAVLEAKRAAFQASVGTITKQEKPLNASSSDVLAQLKATASHLAHQAADAIQAEITKATQTAISSNDLEQFKQALEGARIDAVTKIQDALNQTYDQAQQLGANLDPESQNAIVQFMREVEKILDTELNTICNFIIKAYRDVGSFLPQAFEKIKDFFGQLSTYIDYCLSHL